MPDFEFTSPEGKKYTVSGPDGATKEQAFGILQQQIKSGSAKESISDDERQALKDREEFLGENPSVIQARKDQENETFLDKVKGAGEAALATGSSALRGIAAPFVAAGASMFGYDGKSGIEAQNAAVDRLMGGGYQPESSAGQRYTSNVGETIDKSGIAGLAGIGEMQMLGHGAIQEGKIRPPAIQAARDVEKGNNLPLDTIRNQSQAAGIVTPIEGSSWLAGIKGIPTINKVISKGNEKKFVNLVKSDPDLKIPDGVAITPEELNSIRKKSGQAYQNVIDAGYGDEIKVRAPAVPSNVLDPSGNPFMMEGPEFTRRPGFKSTYEFNKKIGSMLDDVTKKIEYDPETFHALLPSAKLLRKTMKVEHDPKLLMDQIKQLRKDAATEFRSDDPTRIASAFTRKAIANEMEDMIEANLEKTKNVELLQKFRDARRTIAKTYDVESALSPDGTINARKLYQISQKKPLSGNLKAIADYAGAFPEGAQKVVKGQQTMTPFDYMFSIGAAAAGHSYLAAGEIAGRFGVPKIAEKGFLQKKTPSYKPGTASNLSKKAKAAIPYAGTVPMIAPQVDKQ